MFLKCLLVWSYLNPSWKMFSLRRKVFLGVCIKGACWISVMVLKSVFCIFVCFMLEKFLPSVSHQHFSKSILANCFISVLVNEWKLLSCVWPFVTPWTVAHLASLSVELSRQEYWSRKPFLSPGDLLNSRTEPESPVFQVDLYHLCHHKNVAFYIFDKRL